MGNFEIDICTSDDRTWDKPQLISLRSDNICFTELKRNGGSESDQYLHAPPVQLAFWFVDNWWRLRWEPLVSEEVSLGWRLAHELSGIGGGYIWPRLRIWSEDSRIGLASFSDTTSMNFALQFTTDALVFVNAEKYEDVVDRFLMKCVDTVSKDKAALKVQISALKEERNDQKFAIWRKLEAKLGYDIDDAPSELINTFFEFINQFGTSGVEEAIVAAQGESSAVMLDKEIAVTRNSGIDCDLDDAMRVAGSIIREVTDIPVWKIAEESAFKVRKGLGEENGPLGNKKLSELLNVSTDTFRGRKSEPKQLEYGLRLRKGDGQGNLVTLHSRWPQARRFEMCRILGDSIWSDCDALGPVTRTKTARQKFQRAFAQSLLCPYYELLSYISTDNPSAEDISAAAAHFHVSETLIKNVLFNNNVIDKQRYDQLVDAA